MGVLGELFPAPKIADEAGEPGSGEPLFRLGVIDLDTNTVTVVRREGEATAGYATEVGGEVETEVAAEADGD
jgi:hypothetical protein